MSAPLWVSRSLSSIVLSLPVAIWANDTFYSLFRVQGCSMEPALQEGDVVLVRKSDIAWTGRSESLDDATERARVQRQEQQQQQYHVDSWLLQQPPFVWAGDVVVFRSPSTPNEYNIKRVVAQGGQLVRPRNRFRRIELLPPLNVWVEGDNPKLSVDSEVYGSLSKKLLVGKAERIVWPPSRWGVVERVKPPKGRAWYS